jgi:shikimate kinase
VYDHHQRGARAKSNTPKKIKSNKREMKSIIIIGYMGAGKTTVGKALAKELGIMFYDLDWYIESRMHKTVKQIFDESGEDGFRQIEHNMLHEVAEFENIVLSCGGGTPCFFDNMDYMNQLGETVYLKASPETLYAHLKMGKGVRPLLLNKTPEEVQVFIREQLQKREPFYEKAKHIFDVNVMDNFDKINETVAQIRQLLNI